MADFEQRLSELLSYSSAEPADTARALAQRYKSFSALATATYAELSELCGERAALLIRLTASLSSRRVTDEFKFGRAYSEEKIIEFLVALFSSSENETVYLITLDKADKVTSLEFVGEGTVNASGVLPRRLIEIMLLKKAKRAILAHNHPGGKALYSLDDVETTKKIAALFKTADKELICHYIVAGSEVCKVPFPSPDADGNV